MLQRLVFAAVIISLFVAPTNAAKPEDTSSSCSLTLIDGAYGFSLKGTNLSVGQFSFVGRLATDGKGSVSGSGFEKLAGRIGPASFTGSYSVKPDCTGIATLTLQQSVIVRLFFVIVGGGDELLLMDVGDGIDEAGVAKRIMQRRQRIAPRRTEPSPGSTR